MFGHNTYYPVYRNDATGELWDPQTGDILLRQSTSAAWERFKRTIRRYLLWAAVLLASSLPVLIRW